MEQLERCRFCNKEIVLNSHTGRWESDDDWLSSCTREGELKEAFLHAPPSPPKKEQEEELKPKPVPVSQPWIFPWAVPRPPSP